VSTSKANVTKIKYAVAESVHAPVITNKCSWRALCSNLSRVNVGSKDGSGWIAAEIPDGPRRNENVISVSLLVFDIDNKHHTITHGELKKRILSNGYRAAIHSTYNHTPDNPRFRLILDISEPICPENHKALLLHVAQNMGISDFIDKACVDSARYFYLPRCSKERLKDYIFWSSDGKPVDVSAYLNLISISDETLPILLAKEMSQPPDWQENEDNISKVKDYLSYCDANCDYQLWRSLIWAVSSLNWNEGPRILLEWSQQSESHWTYDRFVKTENELSQLISKYDPNRQPKITIATLIAEAKNNGWTPASPFNDVSHLNDTPSESIQISKYSPLGRDQLMALPKLKWRVKGIFPDTGIAAIYGPSSSGKSWLAIDMAANICLGEDWFGYKCNKADVLYLCLEGSAGFSNRIRGWEVGRSKKLPQEFKVIFDDFDLTNALDCKELLKVVPENSVLIVDTLNRATSGKDENSSIDMGLILKGAKYIEQEKNVLVVLVHHSGKNQTKGLRGHSSLVAALDASILLQHNKKLDTRKWLLEKSKDGDGAKHHGFRLKSELIGKDDEDADVTSCSVETCQFKEDKKEEPTGSQQKSFHKVFKSLVNDSNITGKGGASFDVSCVSYDLAVNKGKDALVTVQKSKRSNRAKKIIEDLVNQEFIVAGLDKDENSWLWLPDNN
jgi:hypothetical protein